MQTLRKLFILLSNIMFALWKPKQACATVVSSSNTGAFFSFFFFIFYISFSTYLLCPSSPTRFRMRNRSNSMFRVRDLNTETGCWLNWRPQWKWKRWDKWNERWTEWRRAKGQCGDAKKMGETRWRRRRNAHKTLRNRHQKRLSVPLNARFVHGTNTCAAQLAQTQTHRAHRAEQTPKCTTIKVTLLPLLVDALLLKVAGVVRRHCQS